MHNIKKYIAKPLVLIGALNWGLIGLFNFNLVGEIFGAGTVSRIIYTLVGLAGVLCIYMMLMPKSKK